MPPTNGYATLADLKTRLHLSQGDSEDDSLLDTLITAVSRQIDDYTGHVFYASTLTRVYQPYDANRLILPRGHELLSLSSVQTDLDGDRVYEYTWATTDYDLEPANNPSQGLPYWAICTRWLGNYSFPVGVAQGVKLTGSWGFSSTTPPVVQEACLMQCELAYQNVNAAGQALSGGGEYTQTLAGVGLHPFSRRMLDPFRDVGAW